MLRTRQPLTRALALARPALRQQRKCVIAQHQRRNYTFHENHSLNEDQIWDVRSGQDTIPAHSQRPKRQESKNEHLSVIIAYTEGKKSIEELDEALQDASYKEVKPLLEYYRSERFQDANAEAKISNKVDGVINFVVGLIFFAGGAAGAGYFLGSDFFQSRAPQWRAKQRDD